MQKGAKFALAALIGTAMVLPTVLPVSAAVYVERGYRGPRVVVGPRAWSRGHWVHGWYGGRYGWYWAVGPSWYWYPAPIYPYPAYTEYAPYPYAAEPPPPPPAPALRAPARGQPPGQYWYYCRNPQGYYPDVQTCDNWEPVLATPPSNSQE